MTFAEYIDNISKIKMDHLWELSATLYNQSAVHHAPLIKWPLRRRALQLTCSVLYHPLPNAQAEGLFIKIRHLHVWATASQLCKISCHLTGVLSFILHASLSKHIYHSALNRLPDNQSHSCGKWLINSYLAVKNTADERYLCTNPALKQGWCPMVLMVSVADVYMFYCPIVTIVHKFFCLELAWLFLILQKHISITFEFFFRFISREKIFLLLFSAMLNVCTCMWFKENN